MPLASSILVRPACKDDIPQIATVYAEIYNRLDIGEKWTDEKAVQLFEYYFKNYPELAFIAEYNGKIAGAFFTAVKPWWDGYHLYDGEIFVHQDYQKHGIGRLLLQKVFEAAKEKYQVVCWDFFTFTQKQSPVEWYQKIGIDKAVGFVMMTGSVDEALQKLKV